MKKVFSLLLSLMILFSLAVPAAAAEKNEGFLTFFKYKGENSFTCSPRIGHATDLFDEGFKNIMPGNTIVGYVTVKGDFASFHEDTLKVWMKAVPHNADGNKPKAANVGDVTQMNDFLHQLNLKVYNENVSKTKPIFDAEADQLDGLKENVYLGSFRKNGKIVLRVELNWPADRENCNYNDYAHRTGEVDWLFTVEAFDDPAYDIPKTGDYILRVALPVMAISGAALLLVFFRKKKQRQ